MTDRMPLRLARIDGLPDLPEPFGWRELELDGGLKVAAHFVQDDDYRWVVDCLVVKSGRISANDLRAIPVAQLERELNVGSVRQGPDGEAELYEPGLSRISGETPDDFAQRVARAYQRYARVSRSPAAEIAKASNVPVRTVHGWVREARRRGALPAGRQGSVG